MQSQIGQHPGQYWYHRQTVTLTGPVAQDDMRGQLVCNLRLVTVRTALGPWTRLTLPLCQGQLLKINTPWTTEVQLIDLKSVKVLGPRTRLKQIATPPGQLLIWHAVDSCHVASGCGLPGWHCYPKPESQRLPHCQGQLLLSWTAAVTSSVPL